MAEVLDQWPSITRTRSSKYPWSDWSNGAIWQVTAGADFDSSLKTFVQGLYAYAKRHDLKVEVRADNDQNLAAFRFVPKAQVVESEVAEADQAA